MKKKIKVKIYCSECDENGKKKLAKYKCVICGYPVCKKCENELMGECPNCQPPFFVSL